MGEIAIPHFCRYVHFPFVSYTHLLHSNNPSFYQITEPNGQGNTSPATVKLLAIIVLGDESKSDLWETNAAISATFLQLSAVNLGLGTCWVQVSGRRRSKDGSVPGMAEDYVRELLGIEERMRVLCVIAVGYEAESL